MEDEQMTEHVKEMVVSGASLTSSDAGSMLMMGESKKIGFDAHLTLLKISVEIHFMTSYNP